ncbi:MAG: DUF3015 domain-containing protein [Gammaproteobacteria bacterium]|nr:DUF3015 domain-containing protein [Gammaproteobacteria bacterium]
MKRALISGLLLSVVALPVMAGNEGPGCGLGNQIWKGKSGLMAHISAGTTNSSFSNQAFGITSGTLGCNQNAVASNELEKKVFVASNIDDLAQDIAQGNGQHLSSLAALMGIEEQDKDAFFSLTQSNFENIFNSEEPTYKEVLAALDSTMATDQRFAHYVR